MDGIVLKPVATFAVTVASPVVVDRKSGGTHRVVPITGGTVTGPRLQGRILSSGADYQIVRHDGFTSLDANYRIETADGASIAVHNSGIRHGPPDVMARLVRGEAVDPAVIYFRTMPRFETDHPDYQWLMRSLFVGTGRRFPERVEIDVFEVP